LRKRELRKGRRGASQRTKPTNLAGAGCEEALDGDLEGALEPVEPPWRCGIHRWRNPAKVETPPPFLNSKSGEMVERNGE
jgi:hypothetical protein